MADKRGSAWAAAMQGPETLNSLQNAVRTDLRTEFLKRHEDKPAICIAFALMAEAAALLETRRGPDFAATALERVAQGVRRGAVMGPGDLPGSAMQTNGVDPRAAKIPANAEPKPARAVEAPAPIAAPVAPPPTPAPAAAPPQPVAAAPAPAPTPQPTAAPAPVSKPAVKVLTPKPAPAAPKPESTPAPAPKVIASSKPAAPAPASKPPEVKVIKPTPAKPKPAPGGVIDLRPRGGGDAVA